jgi:hypothetical protein
MPKETYELVATVCEGCGCTFMQAKDPGRPAKFHSDKCRNRHHRRRHRDGAVSVVAMEEAWAEQQAGLQRQWERNLRRRKGQEAPEVVTPTWTHPRKGEGLEQANRRRWCADLLRFAARAEDPAPYREVVERIARRHKLKERSYKL